MSRNAISIRFTVRFLKSQNVVIKKKAWLHVKKYCGFIFSTSCIEVSHALRLKIETRLDHNTAFYVTDLLWNKVSVQVSVVVIYIPLIRQLKQYSLRPLYKIHETTPNFNITSNKIYRQNTVHFGQIKL